jgi:hypothetical protein
MSIVNEDQIGREKRRDIAIGIWIMLSIVWIGGGIRMIMRHNDFGWFLVAIWVFVLVMYMRRAFQKLIV